MVDPKQIERFKKWASGVHAGVEQREKKPKDPASDTPATSSYGHLMDSIYEVVSRKIADDAIDDVKAIAKAFGQSAAGNREENPAEWLLLAFYGAIGPVESSTRSKCKRLGLLLLYAYQKKIKRKRLLGRLYEDGGATRITKLMRESNPNLFLRKRGKKRIPLSELKRLQRERRNGIGPAKKREK